MPAWGLPLFGVVAMWGVFLTAFWAVVKRWLRLRYPVWQRLHTGLAVIVVVSTVVHAVQITGLMELMSKGVLCALAVALSLWTPLKYYRRTRRR